MQHDFENFNTNNENSTNKHFLDRDERLAKRLFTHGFDPYISDKNIFHADLYSSECIENHGRELKRLSHIFKKFEDRDANRHADCLNDYQESRKIRRVYHLTLRSKKINKCHVSEVAQVNSDLKQKFAEHIRYASIPCLMMGTHHKPIYNEELDERDWLDMHFHAILTRLLTDSEFEYLEKRYEVHIAVHDNPAVLIRYIMKSIGNYIQDDDESGDFHGDIESLTDEGLVEYCRQMQSRKRFSLYGDFKKYSAIWIIEHETINRHSGLKYGISVPRAIGDEPILCGIRVKHLENGDIKPILVIRAKSFSKSDYEELERIYDLSAWREYFFNYYAPNSKIRTTNTETTIHTDTVNQDLFIYFRRRE
jgi:hypothetical protein